MTVKPPHRLIKPTANLQDGSASEMSKVSPNMATVRQNRERVKR